MKILLLLFLLSGCSYSVHEYNTIQQNKRMLQHERKSMREMRKARNQKSIKINLILKKRT